MYIKGSQAENQMDRRTHEKNMFGDSDPDRIIITTIKKTLNDVFGRRFITSFNKALRAHSLRWEEIPNNSRLFSELMTKMVGRGYIIIEDLILENLYGEVGLQYDYVEGYKFNDYIERMRACL